MATPMLVAGVPVPVVSERLCHARTSTTVNIYAHAWPAPTATPPISSPTSSTPDLILPLPAVTPRFLESTGASLSRRSGTARQLIV
jgi:hypothetical protein